MNAMKRVQGSKPGLIHAVSALLLAVLMQLALPAWAETAKPAVKPAVAVQQVNINTAPAETLALGLVGVGPARAQAIVDYRKQHGAFKSADELLEVKGIGQSLLDQNRSRIVLQ